MKAFKLLFWLPYAYIRDHVPYGKVVAAWISATRFGFPARRMINIGVTGTNGKTSTVHFIHSALTILGYRTCMLGTVGAFIQNKKIDTTTLTTPYADEIQSLFSRMVTEECTHSVMEVSSHALVERRVGCIPFQIAIFTNLTHDHLDFHGTFDEYAKAKALLFKGLKKDGYAIINVDDPNYIKMIECCSAKVITYSQKYNTFDLSKVSSSHCKHVHVKVLGIDRNGLILEMDNEERRFNATGKFNAYNLGAAYCALYALGVEESKALDALAKSNSPIGRFDVFTPNSLREKESPTIIIDYAHTPDGLENLLQSARLILPKSGKVVLVFGCGGDRDKEKRPVMARVAEKFADTVIVTSDNPRYENQDSIFADIISGFSHIKPIVIDDRSLAIKESIKIANENDVLVLAGKGHENTQTINGKRIHFNEKEVIEEYYSAM